MYISSLEHFARFQHVDGGQDADPTAKLHLFPAFDILSERHTQDWSLHSGNLQS